MRVRVLFFGVLKDLTGLASDSPELPEHATLADMLEYYERKLPRFKELVSSLAMSVNQEYAGPEARLKNGDEVALLPPVSGGSASPHVALVRESIATSEVLDTIKRAEDGAVVMFDGIVRNNTRRRPTRYLEYEAYEPMALKEMRKLIEQARHDFEISNVGIVHRLGRLEIGETSVVISVAAPHRKAAFAACEWLIRELKRTVPIWKKEVYADGEMWVEGEET